MCISHCVLVSLPDSVLQFLNAIILCRKRLTIDYSSQSKEKVNRHNNILYVVFSKTLIYISVFYQDINMLSSECIHCTKYNFKMTDKKHRRVWLPSKHAKRKWRKVSIQPNHELLLLYLASLPYLEGYPLMLAPESHLFGVDLLTPTVGLVCVYVHCLCSV